MKVGGLLLFIFEYLLTSWGVVVTMVESREITVTPSPAEDTTTEFYRGLRRSAGITADDEETKTIPQPIVTNLVVSPESAEEVLNHVSEIFQRELDDLQNPPDCTQTPTFLCGHSNRCGLTCQIHHRAACVMYSYALKVPLIHKSKSNWPFTKPWTAAFQPLGSSCEPNNDTIKMSWQDGIYQHKSRRKPHAKNPLKFGLPIRRDLADIVERFHPSPFLWWVGQFVKYTMRLSREQEDLIEQSRRKLQSYRGRSVVVGIHVRRTDKVNEVSYSNHSLKEYMTPAAAFFYKYYRFQSGPKSVMIASDDPDVIKEAQTQYRRPEWNIFSVNPGFTKKLDSQNTRRPYLLETIRDFILLSESDYIVCGFASNVCRLLLEIKVTVQLNATETFRTVDDDYCFGLSGVYCPEVIVKV